MIGRLHSAYIWPAEVIGITVVGVRVGNSDSVLVRGFHALYIVNTGAGHILRVAVHEIQILFHRLGIEGGSVMESNSLAERQRHHGSILIERVGFSQIALDLSILVF